MYIFQTKKTDGFKRFYLFGVEIFSYKIKNKKGNKYFSTHPNNKVLVHPDIDCNLKIYGECNEVIIKKGLHVSCIVYGNHNKIYIGETGHAHNITLLIGTPDTSVQNCSFSIGDNCSSNGLFCLLLDCDSSVSIGHDCLFSDNIELWASDTHAIYDNNGDVLNLGKSIKIGNHVWIGRYVKILKNTEIQDNSVVGMGSIVTKKFTETNCVITGNPAKIVKRNINWDVRRPDEQASFLRQA